MAWYGVAQHGRARLGLARISKFKGGTMTTIKVGDLVIDYSILPRSGVNFAHVGTLKNAVLAGASFPAIIAERSTKRVVDGLHRHTMYVQLYGEEHEVEVEFRDYADDNELWIAAVEANSAHGLAYSTYDRRRILVEAEKRGISREVISSAIKMPVEKAEKKLDSGSAFVKTPTGGKERVPLRTGLKPLAGHTLTKKAEYHASALVKLLRAGLMGWCSKATKTAVITLHKELAKQV
jgi:hypothetical protein